VGLFNKEKAVKAKRYYTFVGTSNHSVTEDDEMIVQIAHAAISAMQKDNKQFNKNIAYADENGLTHKLSTGSASNVNSLGVGFKAWLEEEGLKVSINDKQFFIRTGGLDYEGRNVDWLVGLYFDV
jgi:hypothetical protein